MIKAYKSPLAGGLAVLMIFAFGRVGPAGGAELDETTRSAVLLLKQCMRFSKSDTRMTILRAVRRLRDPDLAPLFSSLVESGDFRLQVHGLLGLAECSQDKAIDLVRLTELESQFVQREAISVAMDQDLLTLDQARQLMSWPGLDPSVRIVVATFMLRQGAEPDRAFLTEALGSDKIGREKLAALLLLQMGDDGALKSLIQLNRSDHEHRDELCQHLLRTAFKSEFDRVGPWAMDVTEIDAAEDVVRRTGLLVALRFRANGADALWLQQYRGTEDPIARTRLALVALNASYWISPDLFKPLSRSNDALISAIGKLGAAAASREGVTEAVEIALKLNNPQINAWVLDYVKELATDAEAAAILPSVIQAYYGPPERMQLRLQHAITATTRLTDRFPEAAASFILPMLDDAETDANLMRGMLIGLTQCRDVDPYAMIAELPAFADPQANRIVLLIKAIGGHEMTESELDELALMIRGGGRLAGQIRVQAAWAYLKRTDQTRLALAEALSGPLP